MKTWLLPAAACLLNSTAWSQAAPTVQTEEPRAFGWMVGDVISRHVTVEASDSFRFDSSALPKPGRLGAAFELRQLLWRSERTAGGQRVQLRLDYQVFLSPPTVRTLELPPLQLRFDTAGRTQDVRVEAWPVTVSPLVPVEVSPRRGLGELQPDAGPPLIDTAPTRQRLLVCAGLATLLLAYLAQVYLGLPWLARRQRPFEQAWRRLRSLPGGDVQAQQRAAYACVHEALNNSAGHALFEPGVDNFLAAQPHFAALRGELLQFFQRSRREHFGNAGGEDTDALPWLRSFCRRARDCERGAA
jgi:mxaA protein